MSGERNAHIDKAQRIAAAVAECTGLRLYADYDVMTGYFRITARNRAFEMLLSRESVEDADDTALTEMLVRGVNSAPEIDSHARNVAALRDAIDEATGDDE